jgi:malate dehydrogenase
MIRKVSVIGAAGNIGRTILNNLIYQNVCDEIVACDISADVTKGCVLDILQAMTLFGKTASVIPTNDYSMIADSQVVIVPAGFPRKPGMTREDLLGKNIEVIKTIAENIKKYAPNAFIIIITNPLDLMVLAAYKILGFDRTKIVGMSGALDSARLSYHVSQTLNVSPSVISPMVIGAHNDFMVPMLRYTTVSGIPFEEFVKKGKVSKAKADEIINSVKTGGAEIVKYLGTGSAFYGPAAGATLMADSVLNGHARVMPCSVMLDGEYGVKGLFVGTPVLLNKSGVGEIIELDLNEKEKELFAESIRSIQDANDVIGKLL